MRACRWIAPLLIAPLMSAAPVPAGAAPDTPRVGRLVTLTPEVSGKMPEQRQPGPLNWRDEVCEHMEVATQAAARAQILIGGRPAPCGAAALRLPVPGGTPPLGGAQAPLSLRGALIMGPNSRVVFERWLIDVARPEMTLRAQLGEYLVYIMPRPTGLAAGKVQIVTRTATIDLHGTALCLRVAPDGTTSVAVLEGEVTVRGAGGGSPVRVPQGSGTAVAPGRSPQPPSPLSTHAGTLAPHAGGPAFTMPGEVLVTQPPNLVLGRLLNLPKTGHP